MSRRVFCSWSGGKDSCLALYRALGEGAEIGCLVTMMTETGQRSRSHGLALDVLRAQAEALGVPLLVGRASWQSYQGVMDKLLSGMGERGISCGVFGDIDIEDHRRWVEEACRRAGLEAWLPLWHQDRLELVQEFVSAGFSAKVVACRDDLAELVLGRDFDTTLISDLQHRGIDPSGEQGEFHTVVTTGPLFSRPLKLAQGRTVRRDGYALIDYKVEV